MVHLSFTPRTPTLTALVLIALLSENVVADATDWLMRINAAATEVSFDGTLVYIHAGKIETMEIVRRVDEGVMQERLCSLSGPQREVIRDRNSVWYYRPDKNTVVHDYRQTRYSGFPKIRASDFEQLERYYHFVEGVDARIANRLTHQIDVIPNDSYRYGYSLWADKATGLLLRSDLINQQNKIVEQYLFTDVHIGEEITDEQLAAVSNKDELQLFGDNMPVATPVDASDWRLTQIPDGYMLIKHVRKMSPMNAEEVEHIVYSDGLSSISVFIREIREGKSEMKGLSRMGAVHAYRRHLNNHSITVLGEVPAKTVKYCALGVEYHGKDKH